MSVLSPPPTRTVNRHCLDFSYMRMLTYVPLLHSVSGLGSREMGWESVPIYSLGTTCKWFSRLPHRPYLCFSSSKFSTSVLPPDTCLEMEELPRESQGIPCTGALQRLAFCIQAAYSLPAPMRRSLMAGSHSTRGNAFRGSPAMFPPVITLTPLTSTVFSVLLLKESQ